MELEKKAQELAQSVDLINTLKATIEEHKSKIEALETKSGANPEDLEKKIEEAQIELKQNIELLDKSIKEMEGRIEKKKETSNYDEAIVQVMSSQEFKSALGKVIEGERQSAKFEVKADPTSVVTGGASVPVTRTQTGEIYAPGYIANKFLESAGIRTIPQDKNRASWYDGAFFSNVGYIDELTAITTGDGATIEEKYREVAKIGSKLPFSRETTQDMSYFINWAQNEGRKAILAKVDTEILVGEGDDSTAPKKVYGLISKGTTAFNATTAGVALSIENANIADLIASCVTQIKLQGKESYNPNVVFMNPSDVTKLKATKNTHGDYLGFLPNNQVTIYGLMVMETARIDAGKLIVADTSTFQLHQKQALELEIERTASNDGYVMYLRWRGQFIVPTDAIKGNVYVSNITTAIASITASSTPSTTTTTTTA